jgi:hypothetical protein
LFGLAAALAIAQQNGPPELPMEPLPAESLYSRDAQGAKAAQRAREGTLLNDELGSFEFVGDRVVFVPAGSRDSFRVLENLALERVVRELGDGRDQRNWVVSGQFTEYKGANYLLVTKSQIKTSAVTAAPRKAAAPASEATPGNQR